MAMNVKRETWIGLAIILVLVSIFSVVVVRRLTASPEEKSVAASTVPEPSKLPAAPAEEKPDKPQDWMAGRPTLLTPNHASHGSKHSPDELGSWGTAAAKPADAAAAKQTGASLIPAAPQATPATGAEDRYLAPADPSKAPIAVEVVAQSPGAGTATAAVPATADASGPALAPADPGVSAVGGLNDPGAAGGIPPAPIAAAPSPQASRFPDRAAYEGSPPPARPSRAHNDSAVVRNPYNNSSYGGRAGMGYAGGGYGETGRRPSDSAYAASARNDGSYEVQPNDNYWLISERVYGTGAYFRALAEHNRNKVVRTDRLSPGTVIATPSTAELEKSYPDLCPKASRREAARTRAVGAFSQAGYAGGGRTYVVQEGDTLVSIAKHELGKTSRWGEIYELNKAALGKDYNYLTPGMQLAMPAKDAEPADRTTRRPGTEYQR